MTEDKQNHLIQAFPRLFRTDPNSPSSFDSFGIECSNGWYDIIFKLCKDIEAELTKNEVPESDWPHVRQVKEKFGRLRFYLSQSELMKGETVSNITEFRPIADMAELQILIQEAEARSLKICEDCGEKGTLRNDGWLSVRCDACEQLHLEKRKEFLK